jgi:CspA family cold shock protein
MQMKKGRVKFFDSAKGFGFIACEGGGADVFVHIRQIEKSGLTKLREGERVAFDVEPGRAGKYEAVNLSLEE